jgi:hypothetical protein
MTLYLIVDKPTLEHSRKTLDFGVGFHITINKQQPVDFAYKIMRFVKTDKNILILPHISHDNKTGAVVAKEISATNALGTNIYQTIRETLVKARTKAYAAINFAMVEAYWNIGR